MWNLLYPRIPWRLLPAMLGYAVLGALVAGLYGVVHDQVTYTIAPEYFTRLKFDQFSYADLGWPERGFVAEIGFLATWWVGFFAAWFIARVAVPSFPKREAFRQTLLSFGVVFATAGLAACVGYLLGVFHGPDYATWRPLTQLLQVSDVRGFVCVAYIHNGGYLGGLTGLMAALLRLVVVKRRRAVAARTCERNKDEAL
jgi:hypothetical protein